MNGTNIINIQNVSNFNEFALKESILSRGMIAYLTYTFGQYLSTDQIELMASAFKALRMRKATSSIQDMEMSPVSADRDIRNHFIPSKQLRRDEAAYVIYRLAPYSFLSRKDAAIFAKKMFPEFFGSVATINTVFTKLTGLPCGFTSLQVIDIPSHTTSGVEEVLIRLAEA